MRNVICERGHRPRAVDGDRCETPMNRGARCQNRLFNEPEVVRCIRCDRGIYAEGWCSFCGFVDPRTVPDEQSPQDPQIVTAKPLVSGPQTGAERVAKYRQRMAARRQLVAQEVLGQ